METGCRENGSKKKMKRRTAQMETPHDAAQVSRRPPQQSLIPASVRAHGVVTKGARRVASTRPRATTHVADGAHAAERRTCHGKRGRKANLGREAGRVDTPQIRGMRGETGKYLRECQIIKVCPE